MSYRIIHGQTLVRPDAVRSEEFSHEHQALGRARELLEAGDLAVALRDHRGNELSGIRLQLKLGGFSGE